MKTVWLTDNKITDKGVAMLLGGFDGLHIGHRRLLSRAKQSGLPVGIMTIMGGKDGNIFTFAERESIFKENGADFVLELPFSEIKDMSPRKFLDFLVEEFHPSLFVCGEDFRFGAKAQGTPEMLKTSTQVRVEILSLVEMGGEKISSGKIKAFLGDGKVENANVLLGEEFFLCGKVEKDRQIGRTIGFPTANIPYPQDKFPLKTGVYETNVTVDNKTYKGITNYGARPTFDNERVVTETYLDGFSGDLYGKELTVRFVRFLRGVTKFESVDALKKQLEKDINRVRKEL